MNKIKSIAAAILLAVSGLNVSAQTLLNASYDVAREFYKEYNAAFVANYKKTTGKDLKIDQAHGGSSAQARAVNDGLDADVVTMNTTTDIDFLASKGIVAADWNKRFPHSASPTSSTMLFLTRNGNPKNIKDWDDLIKPGIQVIVVNPKTGGNGRMAYLAAWGYVRKKGGSEADAAAFVSKLYKNVPVLAKGGRDATTIFLQRNIGDVLVTFESEVIWCRQGRCYSPVHQHRGRKPCGCCRAHSGQEGHWRCSQNLFELSLLRRGARNCSQARLAS
jgi:sulfate transport system substrate-binding protein